MAKKLFIKGQAPKSPGRPKGSKDKSYLTLQYWQDELMKDWPKLKPAQRAKLSAQIMQMLTNKMKALPSNPADSVRNVEESIKLLDAIEKGKEFSDGSIVEDEQVGLKKESQGYNADLDPIPPPPPNVTP